MLFNLFRKKDNIIKDPIKVEQPSANADSNSAGGMVVEDVFSITGRGTVVTGRANGAIRINDSARITRNGTVVAQTAIAGIEAFRKTLDMAQNGDNVGLLLKDVKRDEVSRGDHIEII